MPKRCIDLVFVCRGCGRRFKHTERMHNCPDCGTSRECKGYAVKGSPYCDAHNTRGHGKMSISKRSKRGGIVQIAARYKDIKSDPQLTTMGPLFTLLVGRLMQLMERVEKNDSPERLKRIHNAWKNLKLNVPGLLGFIRKDRDAVKAYNIIENELTSAFTDYEAWNQMLKVIEQIGDLNVKRMKILKDMQALISADEVYEMAGMLLAAIGNVIDDPAKLEAIAAEFATILGDDFAGGPAGQSEEIIDARSSELDRGQVLYPGDIEGPDLPGEDLSSAIPEGHT